MPRPAALLDLDGTLVDTSWLHVTCWAEALHECGVDVPMHRISRLIGMGGERLVTAAAGNAIEGAVDAWERRFDAVLPTVRPLPGAIELCRALADAGTPIVLASSAKRRHLASF